MKLSLSSGPLLPEILHAPRHDDRFFDRNQRSNKTGPHPLTDRELSHCQRQLGLTGTTRDLLRPLVVWVTLVRSYLTPMLHNDRLRCHSITVEYLTSLPNKIHCRLRVGFKPLTYILFGYACFGS